MSETRWRRSEYMSSATLLIVAGWIWWASARVDRWDMVIDPVKGNDALHSRVTIIETTMKDKQDAEMRILMDIRRDMERRK